MVGHCQHNSIQLAGGKDTTLSKFKTAGGCKSSRLPHVDPAEDQISAMFLLLPREQQETEYTPARARGYSRREHITRGNTYPRVGRTHITVIHQGNRYHQRHGRRYVFGEQKIRGNIYLHYTAKKTVVIAWLISLSYNTLRIGKAMTHVYSTNIHCCLKRWPKLEYPIWKLTEYA